MGRGAGDKCPWNEESKSHQWYGDEARDFPPCFTRGTFSLIRRVTEEGNIEWNGHTYTHEDWKKQLAVWYKACPNIVRKKSAELDDKHDCTPYETSAQRTKATNNPINIDYCWSSMKRIDYPSSWSSKTMVRKFFDDFRVDMWGNICSNHEFCYNESLTKFDVDHLFPWCRGGRSRQGNFAGVYHEANRVHKNDKLIQDLDPEEMACGVQEKHLIACVKYILEDSSSPRKTSKNMLVKLKMNLWQPPAVRGNFSNFSKAVGEQSTNGKFIFDLIEAHCHPSTTTQGPHLQNLEQLTTIPIPTGNPVVYLYISGTRAEIFGPATIQIKDFLRVEIGCTWEKSRLAWWVARNRYGSDKELEDEVRKALAEYEIDLFVVSKRCDMKNVSESKYKGKEELGKVKKDEKRSTTKSAHMYICGGGGSGGSGNDEADESGKEETTVKKVSKVRVKTGIVAEKKESERSTISNIKTETKERKQTPTGAREKDEEIKGGSETSDEKTYNRAVSHQDKAEPVLPEERAKLTEEAKATAAEARKEKKAVERKAVADAKAAEKERVKQEAAIKKATEREKAKLEKEKAKLEKEKAKLAKKQKSGQKGL